MTDEELDFAVRWQGSFIAVVLGAIFAGGVLLAILTSGEW